ncbi:MAG: universal stress protein [Rubrobacteraceae bacterium]
MSMFPTKILLAVDGSEEAESAARAGVGLAKKTGSELHVIYVGPLPTTMYVPESLDYMHEMAEHQGRLKLDEQLQKIKDMGGEVAEEHLVIGRPDAQIVEVAEEMGAGLVVVGSRGIGFVRRALLGSVSESTVHHAHCPVLVVRPREDDESLLGKRILVATDDSEEARMAVEAAVELAEATGAELHLVYALTVEPPLPYPYPYAKERWEESLERAKKKARTFVEEQAEQIRSKARIEIQAHLKFGLPGHEIVELGEELDAGIMILGSRGLGGIRRAQMGSVSDAVLRHAHSPVLVVRQ